MNNGYPKTETVITEASTLVNPLSTGPICVKGPTQRGIVDKPFLVRNRIDFLNEFGYRLDDSDFPLYCLRILDAKGQLYVSRAGHYTTISDKDTLEGTKALGKTIEETTAEVLATATGEITVVGDDADSVTLTADTGSGAVAIASYIKQTGDTLEIIATALMASLIGGWTGIAAGGGTGNYTITAPVGSGIAANTYTLAAVNTGTLVSTIDAVPTGGADAVTIETNFEAIEVGAGFDGTIITISAAASNDPANVDITILPPSAENTQTISNVKKVGLTLSEIQNLNNLSKYVQIIDTAPVTLALGTGTLTGGIQVVTDIIDNDYIGNASQKNGWFSFDDIEDAFRLANIEQASPDVDAALNSYVIQRGDMRGHIGTPIGLTPLDAENYRRGNSPYSHTPINNWETMLVSGDESINDPDDSTIEIAIPGIVEYLALKFASDATRQVFYSTAGKQGIDVGVVKLPNNGVYSTNFLSKGNRNAWDSAYNYGVNALVQDKNKILYYNGNRTLLLDSSKLLSKDNIADLVLFIKLNLDEIMGEFTFTPNDVTLFKNVYAAVLPFITQLEANRGIQKNEGSGWIWIGDQQADKISDVQFNTVADVQLGIYRWRFAFKPIAANEYIYGEVRATDEGGFTISFT